MKKALSLMATAILVFAFTITAFADEQNLEKMNRAQCNSVMQGIGTAIVNSDNQQLQNYSTYFETSAYKLVFNFIERKSVDGSIKDSTIEFTYPNMSSTGDSVVMINYKLLIGSGHNVLYLFEFHINDTGKIYGFNAWEY